MGVYSFASGPASLPPPVKEWLAHDVVQWGASGQSALELPFSCAQFERILAEAETDIRALLGVPQNYRVLFLQGGAFAHFSLLAMNLAGDGGADYIESGLWSQRAIAEASPWIGVRIAARGDGTSLPDPAAWDICSSAAYCHYTSNETANGIAFERPPGHCPVPLVADMSADLFTRPLPVEPFALIYASGQKNLGAAGLTLVIVREDQLGRCRPGTPAPFDYTRQAKENSKVNTPATFAVVVAHRMLRWLIATGGLSAAESCLRRKAGVLYSEIDRDGFYVSPVEPTSRSPVNVRFHLASPRLESLFLREAEANGFLHLAGHPQIGGLRANLYNGVPVEAAEALAGFMKEFRRGRG